MNTPSQYSSSENKQEQSRRGRLPVLPVQAKALDPFPWYREMRESQPVFYDQENNLWHVFRYDDTQRILSDPTTFSSEVLQRVMKEEEKQTTDEINLVTVPSILTLDPPRHRQLRTVTSPRQHYWEMPSGASMSTPT